MQMALKHWSLDLPAIHTIQKIFIFYNHKPLNLSTATFLAFSVFVFYNTMRSHLLQAIGTDLLSLKPTESAEISEVGRVNGQSYSHGTTPTGPAGSVIASQACLVRHTSLGRCRKASSSKGPPGQTSWRKTHYP